MENSRLKLGLVVLIILFTCCSSYVVEVSDYLVPLIYGGDGAIEGEFPWHVAILHEIPPDPYKYCCAGTLIGTDLVLTAAHCTFSGKIAIPADKMAVAVGSISLDYVNNEAEPYKVVEIIRHPNFIYSTLHYDVALLRLAENVAMTDNIQPISVPNGNSLRNGDSGTVVGWGYGDDNAMQETLQKADLKVMDASTCRIKQPHFDVLMPNDESNYCAGNGNKINICKGDGGGGMFFESEGTWYIGGIVSVLVVSEWDPEQCDTHEYVTFSNISFFAEWITQDKLSTNLLNLHDCGIDDHYEDFPEQDKPVFSQYPWVAILEYRVQQDAATTTICNGALIHPEFVLTAGHCVCNNCKYNLEFIRLGDYDLEKDVDVNPRKDSEKTFIQSIPVEKFILHPNYNNPKYHHNIALIKLRHAANTSIRNVKPICLPLAADTKTNYFEVGWRKAGNNSILARQIVQETNAADCQKEYKENKIYLIHGDSILCAKIKNPFPFCVKLKGGSPLQYTKTVDGTNRYYLKGLYEIGSPWCNTNNSDIYSNVHHYLEWIKEQIYS